MKPFSIKDPNKIYTKEELQKESAYPLFEDFYLGEDPNNLSIYNNYKKEENNPLEDYYPLEGKYVKILPEYIQIFASAILIGPKDDLKVEMPLTPECMKAIQLRFSLAKPPTRNEIIKILQKDMDEFYKKFGTEKAVRGL